MTRGAALVIGAGVGGVKASLDLAALGAKVYLCDNSPTIGGKLMLTDKWFPDNHCGLCQLLPPDLDDSSQYCLRRGLTNSAIEVLTSTEVAAVDGEAGHFGVTVVSRGSTRRLEVGAIILSAGFAESDARALSQYGYSRFPNVLTSIDLERMLSPSGPTGGALRRPSDGEIPASVAFLQCVGSRDAAHRYCSSACCMYGIKEASMIKASHPRLATHVFFMDLRAFGKGHYRYLQRARENAGVIFTRCRVPQVRQDFRTNDLLLSVMAENGALRLERFGMVVLSVGQSPSQGLPYLARTLGVGLNQFGFCQTMPYSAVQSTRDGVFVCGSASGPKDISESVIEAGAAAARASRFITGSRSLFDGPGVASRPGVGTPVGGTPPPAVIVIGAGLAGLEVASSLAGAGTIVHLVERTGSLGGHLNHIHTTLEHGATRPLLDKLKSRATEDTRIRLYRETEVASVRGYAGHFSVVLKGKDGMTDLEAAAIVVSSGGEACLPSGYMAGESERVITQSELEDRLSSGRDLTIVNSVVMVQCVGSREASRPYCSRVCCSQALKNAIFLRRSRPDIEIAILYRDIMSYGLAEDFYRQAREMGILFVRYDPEEKPVVARGSGKLTVRVREPVLGGSIVFEPDIVVLSQAIVPPDNGRMATILGVKLNDDGFFSEAEPNFRPLDLRDGIFVCGLAHSPSGVDETIAQAAAVAGRVLSTLSPLAAANRTVSETVQRRCRRCELCIAACEYGARAKDDETDDIVVRDILCRGCGACVVACPSGAARLKGANEDVFDLLDAAAAAAADAALGGARERA
jgi:heterodisulfide reductase subunit A-like polyferredoxin